MASEKEQQQSQLKLLITLGKEQGYLTYAEVNDHLPDSITDTDQVEDIIQMINDMGIPVVEKASDAEQLLMDESPDSGDEVAAEEAAAVLAAVENEPGRTTDPVRMYMREMGTVELLTREGEIEIAKRIEEGIREVMAAISMFPGTVEGILTEYQRIAEEGGRLTDIFSGYIDPDDDGLSGTDNAVVPSEAVKPKSDKKPADDEADVEDDDDEADEQEETDGGPDPEVARQRFGAVQEQLEKVRKVLKKHDRSSPEAIAELEALAQLFMPIKLVPKQYDALVARD